MTAKLRWLAALVVVVGGAALLLPSGAEAQKEKPPVKTEAEQNAATVEAITTAYQLAEFGRKHKSPLALITAGGLLRNLAGVEAKLGTITEKPTVEFDKDAPKDDKAPEPVAAKSFVEQADAMFDEARLLGINAPGLEGLIKMAKDKKYVDVSGERGVKGGPRRIQGVLRPRQTLTYTFHYLGKQPGAVAFQSHRTLHLFVRHHNGSTIMEAADVASQAMWYQAKGGNVVVRLHNPNTKSNATFALYTN